MRITRDSLLQIARDSAAERVRLNRRIVCIYLTGSLLREDALLGGITDIDLFIIHDSQPSLEREVVAIGDEVHLDITHLPQDIFRQPRQMRGEPWISPFIVNHPRVFHDTQHWFEFAQAAISSQYYQPGNVYQRSLAFAALARRGWRQLPAGGVEVSPAIVRSYFKVLEDCANAIASLSGAPLTERRLLHDFPTRALVIGRADLSAGLLSLVAPNPLEESALPDWLEDARRALQAAAALPACPPAISAPRHAYYLRAAQALGEKTPAAGLWAALGAWTQALALLPEDSQLLQAWIPVAAALGFDSAVYPQRLSALDRYLDSVDEALDQWSRTNGV